MKRSYVGPMALAAAFGVVEYPSGPYGETTKVDLTLPKHDAPNSRPDDVIQRKKDSKRNKRNRKSKRGY